jgi:protein-L-isoaspartate(D-aspartate) O-methyltransferase
MRSALDTGNNDAAARRNALVDALRRRGQIRSAPVEAAFRAVPRHLFLPNVDLDQVYADEAIVTKRENGIAVSSSSQPAIMAIMLEQLGLEPGQRVLEIGAATGYNAALLGAMVGDDGRVVTLDIDEDLVVQAREHLSAAGVHNVEAIRGDGAGGWPNAAPYDRIILTVGAWDIAPAWREQLRPGGRLVLPLSLRGPQCSIAFDWDGEFLRSDSVEDCGFMLMRGALAGRQGTVPIGSAPGLSITADDAEAIDAGNAYQLLRGPGHARPLGVQVTSREAFGGLSLWLALHEPGYCRLGAEGDAALRDLVPPLFGWGHSVGTIALLDSGGLAALRRAPGQPLPGSGDGAWTDPSFELWLRGFGDAAVAQRLQEQVAAWNRAGRPGSDALRVRAYAEGTRVAPAPGAAVIQKRYSTLVLEWRSGDPAQTDQ